MATNLPEHSVFFQSKTNKKTMTSHTLECEIFYDLKCFSVLFESESMHKNLLMSVIMDGYPIDTVDLRNTHKILYAMIETKMRRVAENFWSMAKVERKEKFDKMPNINGIMEMINETILKPYNESIRKAKVNPFL